MHLFCEKSDPDCSDSKIIELSHIIEFQGIVKKQTTVYVIGESGENWDSGEVGQGLSFRGEAFDLIFFLHFDALRWVIFTTVSTTTSFAAPSRRYVSALEKLPFLLVS